MAGVEIYTDSTQLNVSAFLLYQGHAELIAGLVSITITIEAKGTVKRLNDGALPGGGRTDLEVQVTFAIDISIFLVIDIDFGECPGANNARSPEPWKRPGDFPILPFPQRFENGALALHLVVLPRNQNPLLPAIAGSTPFADAALSNFEAHLVGNLAGFPHNFSAGPVVAAPVTPPAGARALFEALRQQFKISETQTLTEKAPPPISGGVSGPKIFADQLPPGFQLHHAAHARRGDRRQLSLRRAQREERSRFSTQPG